MFNDLLTIIVHLGMVAFILYFIKECSKIYEPYTLNGDLNKSSLTVVLFGKFLFFCLIQL